jgi:HEPN domain-containing protein
LVNSDITNHEKALRIAKAYLIEAHSDFEAVDTLIEHGNYNLAVYHAQQAVEKIMKACLAAKGKVGIYKHEVYPFFKAILENEISTRDFKILDSCIIKLEEEWALSRYPDWDVEPIWIPSERYIKEDAEDRREKMKAVFHVLTDFLGKNYKLEKEEEG